MTARGVLVLRPAGQNLEVADFGADRRLTPHALLERRSISAWHVARMAEHAEPTIATFAISSTPDAAGKMPESFEVYSMTGAPIGTDDPSLANPTYCYKAPGGH